MRSRSIDNYLSPQDTELIIEFIDKSMERFKIYDGRKRMTPGRFNTDPLQKLYIEKYKKWSNAVNTPLPDEQSIYLDIIRNSEKAFSCPIEQFLKALMQLIEQSIPPSQLNQLLTKLETEIPQCKFECPCPAEK